MCGIFGIVSSNTISSAELRLLARHAQQRGKTPAAYSSAKQMATIFIVQTLQLHRC